MLETVQCRTSSVLGSTVSVGGVGVCDIVVV